MKPLVLFMIGFVPALAQQDDRLPDFLDPARTSVYQQTFSIAKAFKDDPREASDKARFVAEHAAAFDAYARIADKPMEAPESSYDAAKTNPLELMGLRRFSFAMFVRADVAQTQGKWIDAAKEYVNVIRFGQKVEHGPLIHFMTGSAIEHSALKKIENLITHLASGELRDIGVELEQCNRTRIPFREVERREKYFAERNPGPDPSDDEDKDSSQKQTALAHERYLNTEAYTEVVRTLLACARYRIEEKKTPAAIDALVPNYLPSVPRDSFSGDPLRFQITDGKVAVYCVGPNGRDDSGQPDDVGASFSDQTGYKLMIEALSNAARDR